MLNIFILKEWMKKKERELIPRQRDFEILAVEWTKKKCLTVFHEIVHFIQR